jgi:putative ABC transport system permease protein
VTFEISPALRRLRRSPGFTTIVVLGMALGIGASATLFTAARDLLWSVPPYPEPHRLVMLQETGPDGKAAGISLEDFLDLREVATRLGRSAAFRLRSFGLTPADSTSKPAVIQVGLVTSDFFSTLGVELPRGRSFTEAEEESEAPVIVLSHEVARPLGSTVLLNDAARTVVGVLPEGFRFPIAAGLLPGTGTGSAPQAYIPLSHRDYGGKREVRTLGAVARLSANASLDEAREELDAIAKRIAASHPETNEGFGATVVPLEEVLESPNRRPLALLGGGTLALVALVSFNLGGLLLAQLIGRGREVGLRICLGARPRDLYGVVFTEMLLATGAGAALGLLAARFALRALPPLLELLGGFAPRTLALGPGAIAVAALVALAIPFTVASLVLYFGFRGFRGNLESLVRTGSLAGRSFVRARRAVVVAQVALAALLLQSAGLLGRSLLRLSAVDPGFESEGAYAFGLGLPEARYDSDEKMLRFHRSLEESLASIRGVMAAGAAAGYQLSSGIHLRMGFRLEGSSLRRIDWPSVSARLVSPGYLDSLGAPLVRGRNLTWEDGRARPAVALVNRAFESAYFAGTAALGKRIELSWQPGVPYEIVGVAGDIQQLDLRRPAEPEILLPFARFPPDGAVYVFRTSRRDPALGESVRAAVDRLDGRLENIRIRPLSDWVHESLVRERASTGLASFLSSMALALAALGVYGVLAFSVVERRREIALRVALGAGRTDIRSMVVADSTKMALLGLVIGLFGYAFVSPLLRNLVFDLGPDDVPTLLSTILALAAVSAAASWAPAATAVRTDLMDVLRED